LLIPFLPSKQSCCESKPEKDQLLTHMSAKAQAQRSMKSDFDFDSDIQKQKTHFHTNIVQALILW
jgi:hypothetical protein